MNEQECLDFVTKELWSGVRGMALGNVGKKRIVVELAEGEEPKAAAESVSKDAIEVGEDLPERTNCELPPRSTGGVIPDTRVHVDTVIPPSLNESFEKMARSLREWDKREASGQG